MKKNDVVTVEVTDIGIGGEGIGGKCDDLSFCFFDTGFYKIQRKFTGSENKTGSEFMTSQDKFIFICTHNKVPSFLYF